MINAFEAARDAWIYYGESVEIKLQGITYTINPKYKHIYGIRRDEFGRFVRHGLTSKEYFMMYFKRIMKSTIRKIKALKEEELFA